MNKLITTIIKVQNITLLKIIWKLLLITNGKYKTEVWEDNKGNTLIHYVGKMHSNKLWEFSKNKPSEINKLNKEGRSPIHCFIENSFEKIEKEKVKIKWSYKYLIKIIKEKLIELISFNTEKDIENNNLIKISYNKELLIKMIENGGNINKLADDIEKKELGWNTIDYGSFSKKDNMGSPIELLVYYFWEFVLYKQIKIENFKIIKDYYEYFETLTENGANINKIHQEVIIDEEAIIDEFSNQESTIPSKNAAVFFSRFMAQEYDYFALRPFLTSSKIDFMDTDYNGNTILHTLFARISERKSYISNKCCEMIIKDIIENKNLTKKALLLKNNYNVTPLDLIRNEAKYYRGYFESYLLHKELTNELEINQTKKIKVKKI